MLDDLEDFGTLPYCKYLVSCECEISKFEWISPTRRQHKLDHCCSVPEKQEKKERTESEIFEGGERYR